MRLQKTILICIFLLSGYSSFSQNIAAINRFDSVYQACLNKGQDMGGCADTYYTQMDSMLNVVYKSLMARFDKKGKENFKSEEQDWLAKRDEYFSSLQTKDYGTDGNDKMMMMDDDKARFIRDRVIILIKKLTY